MTPAPHGQRCETCGHREVNANDDYYCTVIGDFIAGEIEMATTALVGCASHTSAITLTPSLTANYAAIAAETGNPASELVARDLEEYQEYRRWLENSAERL